MTQTQSISWGSDPGTFTGDVGSVLALSARQWSELGAHFTPTPDGEGEEPGLAVGTIESRGQRLQFGILDYGEDQTFLLVPAHGHAKAELANRTVESLVEAGIVDALDVMDESSPYALAEALDERISALEQSVGETLAEAKPAAEPVAVDVVVLSSGRRLRPDPKVQIGRIASRVVRRDEDRHLGTVKRFDAKQGRVYIEPADGSKGIFVKKDVVVGKRAEIAEGDTVKFRYSIDRKDRVPD